MTLENNIIFGTEHRTNGVDSRDAVLGNRNVHGHIVHHTGECRVYVSRHHGTRTKRAFMTHVPMVRPTSKHKVLAWWACPARGYRGWITPVGFRLRKKRSHQRRCACRARVVTSLPHVRGEICARWDESCWVRGPAVFGAA